METIRDLFATAPMLAWSIVAVLIAVTVIAAQWNNVKWWSMNTWYKFPVFGNLATLARDTNQPDEKGWFKSEKKLCHDYKNFIRLRSERDFNQKVTYLSKARDLGRHPTPKLIWILIAAMVVIEAMGFSYVLAGYSIPGASENVQEMGAIGIAFFVSVLLVSFTHFSGHELYKTGRAKEARREWVDAGRPVHQVKNVPLANNQSIDDDSPGFDHVWNRVGTTETYIITISTVILAIIIAIGAFYVRTQVLEKTLNQQITGQMAESQAPTATLSNIGQSANMPLPSADRASDLDAKKKSLEDEKNIDTKGGMGTFGVLTVLFLFLQVLGVIFGFRWGFAGKESESAYAILNGNTSYDDVREYARMVHDTAQSMLENLQHRMMSRDAESGSSGLHAKMRFHDFMEAEIAGETARRDLERERADEEEAKERIRSAKAANAAAAKTQVVPPPATPPLPVPPAPPPVMPDLPPPPPLPEPVKQLYYLNASRTPSGPLSLAEIEAGVKAGTIPANTMVIEEGGAWRTL